MKGSTKRKCPGCCEFYLPDRRNLWHQCYCSKPACRKQSKAESQRRWLRKPDNQNYFRGPENSRRVQEWRKRNPGYGRKKNSTLREPLQEVCTGQVAQNEELTKQRAVDASRSLAAATRCPCGTYIHNDRERVTRRHSGNGSGIGTQRTGHPGH
jgi:hypothetical protein